MDYNEIEKEVVDIVLSIPLKEWTNQSSNGRVQTLFKGKCIELSKTNKPDGNSYSTIHIEGFDFRDESGERCKLFYDTILNHLNSIKESKYLDRIKLIYNHLKN